ncbi:MAG: T9SS type A sorting domain-containing protein [Flavobacteriales bacterium]|nr:T9SS type A sorting domain-containing protein [Flavobacteriales bacterium]
MKQRRPLPPMLLLCALLVAHVSLAGHFPTQSSGPSPLLVDCPGLGLNFGDPCDDGDPCTIGTTVDGSCQCSGGIPACDDSDPCTTDLCVVPGACTVPDNGSGSADLPAASCPYACAPGEAMQIISGLPVGTTIDIPSTIQNLVCSPSGVCSFASPTCMQPQGLGYSSCRSGMVLMPMTGTGSLAGFNRNIPVPIDIEMIQLSLTSGPVQVGDADLFRLFGQITGDPDFDLLRITGGTDFGLPSPGHTTLVQLPGGNWAVDSFFDITYRIDFVGAAGGPLAGMSGSTTGTVRMQTPAGAGPPVCISTPLDCDDSDPCTTDLCIVPGACTVPDNGSGSADLPAASCPYLSGPGEAMYIIDGLPPGTTIDIPSTIQNLACTPSSACSFSSPTCMQSEALGYRSCRSGMVLMPMTGTGALAGFSRNIPVPIDIEMVQLTLTSGPVQVGDADLFRLFGQITGDPDFDLLRITGGTDFGLPSPGHTTLVQLPGGNWAVDSFFDITYRIDFVGAAGGPLAGMSGSTTGTLRMGTPPGSGPSICVHTPIVCDDDDPCTSDACVAGVCVFTPSACCTSTTIEMGTDGGGLRWALHDAGTNVVVASSPGYPAYEYPVASPDYTETTCLPDGEFYFVFEDEDCNGIANGGYIVRVSGKRVIDNRTNLNNGCTSEIAGNTGVNVPVGNDRLISASCDRLELRRGVNANCSDRLTADDTPNGTSGNVYQFWIYEPNGGLSIRYPANGPGSNQVSMANLPSLVSGTMYNVRVRTRISPGVWRAWGSACRMKIDNMLGQCGAAGLVDDPSNANHSCGKTVTLPPNNSSSAANRVVCMPVTRYNNNCVNVQANKYQFRFRLPAENVVIVRNSTTNFTHMFTSSGFAPCRTYEVEVRASFDGGANWCRGNSDPYAEDAMRWGPVCEVYTAGCDEEFAGNTRIATDAGTTHLYPNPNRGDQLYLSLDAIQEGVQTVSVDIYDAFGKRVSARTIIVNDGFVNTVLELNGELATGLYMVHITAGDAIYTERLVIQP